MTATRVHALRHRIAAARAQEETERGSVLVYVLIVTMLVTTAVTALVMTATQAITPTQDSVNRTAAYAAAQAGIQDALAYVNTQCPKYGVRCDTALGATQSNVKAPGTDALAGSNQSFRWTIGSAYVTDANYNRYLRVTSVGTSRGRSTALVADVQAVPSPLDYEYYSTYETNGTADVAALNPARTVSIDCGAISTAASAISFPCSSGTTTATWNGSAAATTAGSSNASYPSPAVCDKLYYDSATYNGSSAPGRYSLEQAQLAQGLLTPGADWRETGTVGTTSVKRDVPCQVMFTNGQTFNGKVYTVDAPEVSNATPGTSTSATFAGGLTTAWQRTSYPQSPAAAYYPDPYLPNSTITGTATSQSNPLSFSNTFNPTPAATSCIFSGPTRIKLNGDGTATVTSPQTTTALQTGQAGCYQTKNSAGQFTVDYTRYGNGVIYVKNDGTKPSGGWPTTGQRTGDSPSNGNTAFYLRGSAPATTQDPNTATAAQWTQAGDNADTWSMYSSTKKCGAVSRNTTTPNGPKPWDEQTFQCDWFGRMGDNTFLPPLAPSDGYTAAQTTLAADLAGTSSVTVPGNPGTKVTYNVGGGDQTKTIDCSSQTFVPVSATADQLVCLIQHDLRTANTGTNEANWSSPSKTGYTHQYVVSKYAQTTTTATRTVGAASSLGISPDSFFTTSQAGTASTELETTTTTTFNIASQVYGCYDRDLLGNPTGTMDISGNDCTASLLNPIPLGVWSWGNGYTPGTSSPQFQFSLVRKTYSNFTQGTTATAYFPSMSDVTQYGTGTGGANGSTGPGDAYVEGVNSAPLSVLSDGDTVVTGNLTTSGTGATLLDALGDIRVYNPVSCVQPGGTSASAWAAQIAATTPGFCPNDLTGLYTGGLISGSTLLASHPARQYSTMLPTPVSTISAALVAQGSGSSTGSIRTDNANRGPSDGTLTVTGGMYQRHRGSLGVQWEYLSTSSGARAGSGYKVSMTYQDLQNAGLTYLPAFQGGSVTRYWNVVSASSCTKVSNGVCVGSSS